MEIVSRAQWGARAPKSRVTGDTVTETYLHHTAGAHSGAVGMRSIQTFHMDHRGWADIAYNFVIDPDTLTVYEGRGWGARPGSQKAHNRGTWSVCVMGNFQSETPPVGLVGLIADLIVYGYEQGHLPLELTGGHKDAPGQATSCPGAKLHQKIPTIRQLLTQEDTMTPEQEAKLDQVLAIAKRIPESIDDPFFSDRPSYAALVRRIYLTARNTYLNSAQTLRIVEELGATSGLTDETIDRIARETADEFGGRLLD